MDDGANEDYWTWALDDANGVAQGMAMTPAAGNHEAKSEVEGITDANPIVSHFNLANVPEGQDLSTGVYYSYVYKNATFVVLNTNDLEATRCRARSTTGHTTRLRTPTRNGRSCSCTSLPIPTGRISG